ncbi:MAG: SOS response-associated peptidase [Burkholderiaceae bacterium]|nr:SOS response-associated peptidase [Burkholderiaceae bacterium]
MCGRYVIQSDPADVARAAGAQLAETYALPPTWNAAPAQFHPVVIASESGEVRMGPARWGLVPSWAKELPKTRPINARSESLFERPMFRHVAATRRCLVPADGWYEWVDLPEGKQPWYHCAARGEPMFFAGLWDLWQSPDGPLPTYTILTRDAVAETAEIHDRMPMVLDERDRARWISPQLRERDAVNALIAQSRPPPIRRWKVGRAVGKPSVDGPQLIEPIEA